MKIVGRVDMRETNNGYNVVTIDGMPLDIEDSRRHIEKSLGFSWGYLGSGPAQLSYAVLLHLYGVDIAEKYYQRVKEDIISRFPVDENFELDTKEIDDYIKVKTEKETA